MSSPKKRITLSFSVPSGGDRDTTATSIPRSAQTQMAATVHHPKKETMRPTNEPRPKTFMDNWVEPPLRPPQPSFTDYPHLRIERYGVLERMEPLGTMPPAKAKKLVKQNERSRASVNADDSDASTVAGTPREMLTPEPPINTIIRRSYSRDADNAEWNPQPPPNRRMSASKTTQARGSAARPSESPVAKREERHMEQTDKAVQFAVEDAILNRRWPTAYALRTLYNEHKINPRIQRLFMLVFLGRANENEQKEFRTMITWKKRQGAKNHTAQRYFDENDNVYAPTPFLPPFNPRSSTKDRAEATDRGASTSTPTSPHKHDTTTHASKKPKVQRDDPILQKTSYNDLISKSKSTTNGISPTKKGSPSQHHEEPNHVTQSPRRDSDSDFISARNMGAEESVLERPRAASISSSSSLSSLDEAILGDLESPARPADLRLNEAAKVKGVRERKAANSAEKPGHDRSQRQPITRHDEHVHTTNNFTAVNASSPSNTPTPNPLGSSSSTLHRNGDNGMRPQSDEPYSLPPPLPSTLQFSPTIKSHKKTAAAIAAAAKKAASYSPRDADIIRRKKQIKSQAEKEYQEELRETSFVRTPVSIPEPEPESEAANTITVAPHQPSQIKPILRFKPRPAGDDSDVQSSPSRLTFRLDFESESAKNSRASTPTGASRASRKSRNPGPRMKSSPKKKSSGALAGLSRADDDRQYSPSTGEHGQQDDNDDFCSSCRGSGDLVCCDGCTRSFHLRCVDPPMDQNDLPDEWFCNVCVFRKQGVTPHTGLFGNLITQLEKKNPSAFRLPPPIREHFEGVRTGPDGEYEEGTLAKKGKHEEQDLYRLFDKKGEPVICHACSRSSGGTKPIITCSYCGLSWHLDCLDPPLATAPSNGPTRPWMCPCHVDDVVGLLGGSHKFRKVKGKAPIRPEFARGVKNEGHIEVELAPSDDEKDGFFEEREFGRVYVLPEEGIKLDFISRVHEKRREQGKEDHYMANAPSARPPTPPLMMDEHSLEEQQAALNLAALCNGRDTTNDGMKTLTNAMVAGISGTGAVEIIAKGAVTKLVKSDDEANDSDLAMLELAIEMGKQAELIKQKIEAKKQRVEAEPKGDASTNGDVDVEMVEIKKAPSSSPPPAPASASAEKEKETNEALAPRDDNSETEKKRKLGGKDGFLDAEDAENSERAKRSRSR